MSVMVASTYATLVLWYIEIQFCEKCKNEVDVNKKKYIEQKLAQVSR